MVGVTLFVGVVIANYGENKVSFSSNLTSHSFNYHYLREKIIDCLSNI